MQQLTTAQIIDQIQGMEDATKKELLDKMLEVLADFRTETPETEGYDFAIGVLKANWPL